MIPEVVVDARMLSYPLTGIGRYTYEVLSRVVRQPGAAWVLLTPRPVPENVASGFPDSVRWVTGTGDRRAELWTQLALVRELRRSGADWFLGFGNSVPLLPVGRARRALVVYDLCFLAKPRLVEAMDLIKGWLVGLPAILRADRLLPISPAVEAELHNRIPSTRGRTRHLPPGGARLMPGAAPLPFEGRRGFLAVGAGARKNTPLVLRAFARLPESVRRNHPLIIAAQHVPAAIHRLAGSLSLGDSVRILEGAPDGELARLYRDSIALVYPSACEGLGLPAAEALLTGLPSIVPADSPMGSLVGTGGLKVALLTQEVLAEVMLELATRKDTWNRCVGGTAEAASRISWELTSDSLGRALELWT